MKKTIEEKVSEVVKMETGANFIRSVKKISPSTYEVEALQVMEDELFPYVRDCGTILVKAKLKNNGLYMFECLYPNTQKDHSDIE